MDYYILWKVLGKVAKDSRNCILYDFLNDVVCLNSPKEKADNRQMKAFLYKHLGQYIGIVCLAYEDSTAVCSAWRTLKTIITGRDIWVITDKRMDARGKAELHFLLTLAVKSCKGKMRSLLTNTAALERVNVTSVGGAIIRRLT